MIDYKNLKRDQQCASAWAALVYGGIVILLLTAPTWGPWIDGICK